MQLRTVILALAAGIATVGLHVAAVVGLLAGGAVFVWLDGTTRGTSTP